MLTLSQTCSSIYRRGLCIDYYAEGRLYHAVHPPLLPPLPPTRSHALLVLGRRVPTSIVAVLDRPSPSVATAEKGPGGRRRPMDPRVEARRVGVTRCRREVRGGAGPRQFPRIFVRWTVSASCAWRKAKEYQPTLPGPQVSDTDRQNAWDAAHLRPAFRQPQRQLRVSQPSTRLGGLHRAFCRASVPSIILVRACRNSSSSLCRSSTFTGYDSASRAFSRRLIPKRSPPSLALSPAQSREPSASLLAKSLLTLRLFRLCETALLPAHRDHFTSFPPPHAQSATPSPPRSQTVLFLIHSDRKRPRQRRPPFECHMSQIAGGDAGIAIIAWWANWRRVKRKRRTIGVVYDAGVR